MRIVYQVNDPKYGVTALFETIEGARKALETGADGFGYDLLPSGLNGWVDDAVVYESFDEYVQDMLHGE